MNKPANINWHLLLGRLLKLTLEPFQIEVQVEVPLLTKPPLADIILIRRTGDTWNDAQRRWLADGLRDTAANRLLLEFKYSEGLTLTTLQQLNTYDYLYRMGEKLDPDAVACFLVVAKTPQGNWQEKLGFTTTQWQGVYQGLGPLANRVQIILLNELTPADNNVALKCFASRIKEQRAAFAAMQHNGFVGLSKDISLLIFKLWRLIMSEVAEIDEFTEEDMAKLNEEMIDFVVQSTSLDDILGRYDSDTVLSHYQTQDRLKGLPPEERLKGLPPDKVFDQFDPAQIRAYLDSLSGTK